MLEVAQVYAGETEYQANIQLPVKYHRPGNVLQVSAVSSFSSDSRCDTGPELIAEMDVDTRLTVGRVRIENTLNDVRDLLRLSNDPKLLGFGRLSPLEATKATQLLAAVMPKEAHHGVAQHAQIQVLRRDDLAKRHRSQGWFVYQNTPSDDVIALPVGVEPHELAAIESPILLHIRPLDGGEL